MNKLYSFLRVIKPHLINFLKAKAIGSIIAGLTPGGLYAKIATFILKHFFEEIAKPIIDAGIREIGYKIEIENGKKLIREISTVDNVDDFNDVADRV